MLKLVLLDSDENYRRGLRLALEADEDFDVLVDMIPSDDAIEQVAKMVPDVILLDPQGFAGDVTSACYQIGTKSPTARMLILTGGIAVKDVVNALRTGASGYWTKTTSLAPLAAVIRAVSKGAIVLAPDAVAELLPHLQYLGQGVVNTSVSTDALTRSELAVFWLAIEGATYRQMADELGRSPKTVKAHMLSIYKKLGISGKEELRVLAIREGLVPPIP